MDVALIDENLHGYEIKSQTDNLKRLPQQIENYDKFFDYNTLVVYESHLNKALEMLPESWGVIIANSDLEFNIIRSPIRNNNTLLTHLLDVLWKIELRQILIKHNIQKGVLSKNTKHMAKRIKENLDKDIIHSEIVQTLKTREYINPNR